jgi:hypothetical protein
MDANIGFDRLQVNVNGRLTDQRVYRLTFFSEKP